MVLLKQENMKVKNKKVDFLVLCHNLWLLQWYKPVISSVVKDIIGRGVTRAGREYYNIMNKKF